MWISGAQCERPGAWLLERTGLGPWRVRSRGAHSRRLCISSPYSGERILRNGGGAIYWLPRRIVTHAPPRTEVSIGQQHRAEVRWEQRAARLRTPIRRFCQISGLARRVASSVLRRGDADALCALSISHHDGAQASHGAGLPAIQLSRVWPAPQRADRHALQRSPVPDGVGPEYSVGRAWLQIGEAPCFLSSKTSLSPKPFGVGRLS